MTKKPPPPQPQPSADDDIFVAKVISLQIATGAPRTFLEGLELLLRTDPVRKRHGAFIALLIQRAL